MPTTPYDPYTPTADELSYYQNTGGLQRAAGMASTPEDSRVSKFLAPHLRGPNMSAIGDMTQLRMMKMAQNPYELPEGMLTTSLKRNEDVYGQASSRIKAAGAASGNSVGGEAGGVQKAMQGNVEMARAAGSAESLRAYDEMRTKIGDDRMANIIIPYVQNYERQYADALAKLTPKKKKNWLKAIAGVAATVVGGVYGQPWLMAIGGSMMGDSGVIGGHNSTQTNPAQAANNDYTAPTGPIGSEDA